MRLDPALLSNGDLQKGAIAATAVAAAVSIGFWQSKRSNERRQKEKQQEQQQEQQLLLHLQQQRQREEDAVNTSGATGADSDSEMALPPPSAFINHHNNEQEEEGMIVEAQDGLISPGVEGDVLLIPGVECHENVVVNPSPVEDIGSGLVFQPSPPHSASSPFRSSLRGTVNNSNNEVISDDPAMRAAQLAASAAAHEIAYLRERCADLVRQLQQLAAESRQLAEEQESSNTSHNTSNIVFNTPNNNSSNQGDNSVNSGAGSTAEEGMILAQLEALQQDLAEAIRLREDAERVAYELRQEMQAAVELGRSEVATAHRQLSNSDKARKDVEAFAASLQRELEKTRRDLEAVQEAAASSKQPDEVEQNLRRALEESEDARAEAIEAAVAAQQQLQQVQQERVEFENAARDSADASLREMAALREQVDTLTQQLISVEHSRSQAVAAAENAEIALQNAREEAQFAIDQMANDGTEQIQELQANIEALQSGRLYLEEQVDLLERARKEAVDKADSLQQEIQAIKFSHEKDASVAALHTSETITELEKRVDSLQAELVESNKARVTAQMQRIEVENALDGTRREIDTLRQDLKVALEEQRRLASLENAKIEAEELVANAQREMEMTLREIYSAKEGMLQQEISKAREAMEVADRLRVTAETARVEAENATANAERELKILRLEVEEAKKSAIAAESLVASTQQELQDVIAHSETASATARAEMETAFAAREEANHWQQQAEQLQHKLAETESALVSAEQQAVEAQAESARLQEESARAEQVIQAETDNIRAATEKALQQLNAALQDVEEAQRRALVAEEARIAAETAHAAARNEIDHIRRVAAEEAEQRLANASEAVKHEVNGYKQQIAALSAQVNQAENEARISQEELQIIRQDALDAAAAISALRQELADARAEAERAHQSLDEKTQAIQEHAARAIEDSNAALTAAQNAALSLEKELIFARQEADHAKQLLAESEQARANDAAQLQENARAAVDDAREELIRAYEISRSEEAATIRAAQDEIAELNRQLALTEEQTNTFEQLLASSQEQFNRLNQDYSAAQKELDAAIRDGEEAHRLRVEAEAASENYQKELARAEEQLAEAASAIQHGASATEAAERELARVQGELDRLVAAKSAAEEAAKHAEAEAKTNHNEVGELHSKLFDIQAQFAVALEKNSRLETELEQARHEIAQANEVASLNQRNYHQIQEQMEEIQRQRVSSDASSAEIGNAFMTAQQELVETQKQLEAAREQIEKADAARQAAEKRLAVTTLESEQLLAESSRLFDEVQAEHASRKATEEAYDKLRHEMQTAKEQAELRLVEEIAKIKKENAAAIQTYAESQVSSLRAELEKAQAQIAETDSHKDEVERTRMAAQQEIDYFSREVDRLRSSLASAEASSAKAIVDAGKAQALADLSAKRAQKAEEDLADAHSQIRKTEANAEHKVEQITREQFDLARHSIEERTAREKEALLSEVQQLKKMLVDERKLGDEVIAAVEKFTVGRVLSTEERKEQGHSVADLLVARQKDLENKVAEATLKSKKFEADLNEERKESARLSDQLAETLRRSAASLEERETALDRAATAERAAEISANRLRTAETEVQRLQDALGSGDHSRQSITAFHQAELASMSRASSSPVAPPSSNLSSVYSPTRGSSSLLSTSGASSATRRFGDTGVRLAVRDSSIVVSHIMQDSPADASNSGVEIGDVVLAIDGKPVTSRELRMAQGEMYGEQGTRVMLQLRRGSSRPSNVELQRGTTVRSAIGSPLNMLSSTGGAASTSSSRPTFSSAGNIYLGGSAAASGAGASGVGGASRSLTSTFGFDSYKAGSNPDGGEDLFLM